MSVNNPRNRILIFRLTQGEYDAQQTASSEKARGACPITPVGSCWDLRRARRSTRKSTLKTTVTRIAQLLEKE